MKKTNKYADTHFLQETLEELKDNGLTENDIVWIGNHKTKCDWHTFIQLADFYYDDGFGIEEIQLDLKIVGKDWWLERDEYDGSERWVFKKLPVMPKDTCFSINEICTLDLTEYESNKKQR